MESLPPPTNNLETTEADETISNTIQLWLKYNDSPFDEVDIKWRQTFHYRRHHILKATSSLSDILNEWPLYKNASLGPKLVSNIKIEILNSKVIFFLYGR